MKTKIFKSVLPALAILLAMGLSFAVEANRVNQMGYYNDPLEGVTEIEVNCSSQNTTPCLFGEYQVFADEELEIPLFKNNP